MRVQLWLALPFLLSSAAPAARKHVVEISQFKFAPAEVHVARGDTIVWINRDAVPHTATALDRKWDAGNAAGGASVRWTPRERGKFTYFCAYHPGMKGMVVVK